MIVQSGAIVTVLKILFMADSERTKKISVMYLSTLITMSKNNGTDCGSGVGGRYEDDKSKLL